MKRGINFQATEWVCRPPHTWLRTTDYCFYLVTQEGHPLSEKLYLSILSPDKYTIKSYWFHWTGKEVKTFKVWSLRWRVIVCIIWANFLCLNKNSSPFFHFLEVDVDVIEKDTWNNRNSRKITLSKNNLNEGLYFSPIRHWVNVQDF